MADLTAAYTALQKADAAGDTAGAKQLADYIRSQAPQSAPAAPAQPQAPVDATRQVALGGRAVGEGVFGTLGSIAENTPFSLLTRLITGKTPQELGTAATNSLLGTHITAPKPIGEMLSDTLTRFGAPTPNTPGEHLAFEGIRGASGALALGGAASLPGAIRTGVSGTTGGLSSEYARQEGVGPVGQTIAGVVGGAAPSLTRAGIAELAKRSVRGGETGRQAVENNIQAFQDAGATPSMGQATGNRRMQAAESLLSRAPGGAGVMAAKAEGQAADIGAGVSKVADQLAPKTTAEQAGRAIDKGVNGPGGFLENFKDTQKQLYGKVDAAIPAQTRVDIPATRNALDSLNPTIPGAPNTSKLFQNSRIKGIQGAVNEDLMAAPLEEDLVSQVVMKMVRDVAPEKAQALLDGFRDGKLPYEAVSKLRTLVGNEISDNSLMSDVPRSKWKALYGALSTDLEGAAKQQGPAATAAWNRANTYTRAGMDRLDTISSVIDKNGGPEAVFQAAISGTKEGATTLRAVMQSVPEGTQKIVSSTVLRRLGRATPGKQNDLGEKFSTETFLTNWNSMSPQAKAVLFDRYGPDFRQNMDQIAKVTDNLRQGSKVFQNPSGTAQASIQYGTAGAALMSVLTGNVGTAAAIGTGVAASNLSARLLTNPNAVRWLAQRTKAPVTAIPAMAAQALQSRDPDLQALGQQLQQAQNQQPHD